MTDSSKLSLSVVVASYNRAHLLPKLLAQLEMQTLGADEFEVILVDDGSRSPVRPLLEKLSTRLSVRLIEQKNQGQAAARDRGIRDATGEIVVIIDDDMELAPELLEAHRRRHDRGDRVVLGRILPAPVLENMPLFERFHARQLDKMVDTFKKGGRPRGVHLCTGNVSFRRQDYLQVGGFDRSLRRSEDRELGIRLEYAGASFAFAEEASTVHDSDHTSLEVWLERAFNYGLFDTRIYEKHPSVDNSNPWRFFFLVNPVSRPLLLMTTLAPGLGKALSPRIMRACQFIDDKGWEGLALRGTTLVYGLEYFRGMRAQAGSLGRSLRNLMAYVRQER